MPGGDAIEACLLRGDLEKLQSRLARRLFQIALLGQFHLAHNRRPAEALGLLANEFRIAARFLAAQTVVQMQHGESQFPFRRKLAEQMQQAQGIRAARYGHAHVGGAPEHVITSDGRYGPLQHSSIVASSSKKPPSGSTSWTSKNALPTSSYF